MEMSLSLRSLFFLLIVRPLVFLVLGLNVRNRKGLPLAGPAIVVANHNSHLDTLVLLSLFPHEVLNRVRPVAAQDYFLRNRWLAWFSLKIIGIIPLRRNLKGVKEDPLAGCSAALERGEILIVFPEGSRGEPEVLSKFKTGVAHLAQRYPQIPLVPVFMHGLGRALPKGEWVLVPVVCDVLIGSAFSWGGSRPALMAGLEDQMKELGAQIHAPPWEESIPSG